MYTVTITIATRVNIIVISDENLSKKNASTLIQKKLKEAIVVAAAIKMLMLEGMSMIQVTILIAGITVT